MIRLPALSTRQLGNRPSATSLTQDPRGRVDAGMGGYKGKAKTKKGGGGGGRRGGPDPGSMRSAEPHNFVAEAGPGCIIAHVADPPWALGSERIDIRDYPKGTQFPDLAVDPGSGTLSVVNAQTEHRVVSPRALVLSRRLVVTAEPLVRARA